MNTGNIPCWIMHTRCRNCLMAVCWLFQRVGILITRQEYKRSSWKCGMQCMPWTWWPVLRPVAINMRDIHKRTGGICPTVERVLQMYLCIMVLIPRKTSYMRGQSRQLRTVCLIISLTTYREGTCMIIVILLIFQYGGMLPIVLADPRSSKQFGPEVCVGTWQTNIGWKIRILWVICLSRVLSVTREMLPRMLARIL